MAELNPSSGGTMKRGRIRSKKLSTRIDMTSMVDLAFLLLTFFILTTTLSKPHVMQIVMPEKDDVNLPPALNENDALTIVLDKDNAMYWYMGITDPHVERIPLKDIHQLLVDKKARLPRLVLFIKATDTSKYQNLTDLMDEIIAAKIDRYCIVDITPGDEALVKTKYSQLIQQ